MLHGGSLKIMDRGYDGVENSTCRFDFIGFRVDAEQILGARGADHDPADVGEINLDSVESFAARDRQVEKFVALAIGEIGDGLFFLPGLYVEVDAAVMVFAKFSVKR